MYDEEAERTAKLLIPAGGFRELLPFVDGNRLARRGGVVVAHAV